MNSKENQVFNLLLIENIFKKNCKTRNKKEKERMGEAIVEKSYVYTCLHDIFAELTIDYKEEFCRYLRINTASYQVRFV